jgi:hypothetical protein
MNRGAVEETRTGKEEFQIIRFPVEHSIL